MLNSLINVSFVDQTNYSDFDNQDIVGCPIDHIWGPVNTVSVLSRPEFERIYPLSLPLGVNKDPGYLKTIANVYRLFESGASLVEVIRPLGNSTYAQFNVSIVDNQSIVEHVRSTTQFSKKLTVTDEQLLESPLTLSIALRYPGTIPQRLFPYSEFLIEVEFQKEPKPTEPRGGYEAPVVIKVIGKTGPNTTVVEHHIGSFTRGHVVDGRNFFIEDVLRRDSRFIDCVLVNELDTELVETITLPGIPMDIVYEHTPIEDMEFADIIRSIYATSEKSVSTLLLSPVSSLECHLALQDVARERMDCIAVTGYPVDNEFTKTKIKEYKDSLIGDKFSIFVAGRESVNIQGETFVLDCTSGWAGRASAVAGATTINQLPSAKAYGQYTGNLIESLDFADVLDLHKEGVISVYSTTNGPLIFGIRTLHPRQTSYYGKANVMRVLAGVLKNVLGSVLEVMHTSAAADASSRAAYETQLNSIINEYIGNRSLRPQSRAIVGEELNNDAVSKGGEVLTIELSLWFIKLVEEVKIRVVATDSSVTVDTL